jgi:hypothetical protein
MIFCIEWEPEYSRSCSRTSEPLCHVRPPEARFASCSPGPGHLTEPIVHFYPPTLRYFRNGFPRCHPESFLAHRRWHQCTNVRLVCVDNQHTCTRAAVAKDNNNNKRCAACKTSRPDPCRSPASCCVARYDWPEYKVGQGSSKPIQSIL